MAVEGRRVLIIMAVKKPATITPLIAVCASCTAAAGAPIATMLLTRPSGRAPTHHNQMIAACASGIRRQSGGGCSGNP